MEPRVEEWSCLHTQILYSLSPLGNGINGVVSQVQHSHNRYTHSHRYNKDVFASTGSIVESARRA